LWCYQAKIKRLCITGLTSLIAKQRCFLELFHSFYRGDEYKGDEYKGGRYKGGRYKGSRYKGGEKLVLYINVKHSRQYIYVAENRPVILIEILQSYRLYLDGFCVVVFDIVV
jgi:hypothetical protein